MGGTLDPCHCFSFFPVKGFRFPRMTPLNKNRPENSKKRRSVHCTTRNEFCSAFCQPIQIPRVVEKFLSIIEILAITCQEQPHKKEHKLLNFMPLTYQMKNDEGLASRIKYVRILKKTCGIVPLGNALTKGQNGERFKRLQTRVLRNLHYLRGLHWSTPMESTPHMAK